MYVIQYAAGGLVGPFLSHDDAHGHLLSTDEGHVHELEPANIVERPFSMTLRQVIALAKATDGRGIGFDASDYRPAFDLPTGYVAGWVGPIYLGVSPEGDISS
jgi:hypothetical protein